MKEKRAIKARLSETMTASALHKLARGEVTLAHVLGMTPEGGAAFAAMARHLYVRGDYFGARDVLSTLCRLNPRDAHSHWSLGLVYQAIGDDDLADRAFLRAIEEDGSLVGPHIGRAELAWARADRDAARREVTAALARGIEDETLRRRADAVLELLG